MTFYADKLTVMGFSKNLRISNGAILLNHENGQNLMLAKYTCFTVTCPRPLRNSAEAGLEPTIYKSQVRCPTDSATMPHNKVKKQHRAKQMLTNGQRTNIKHNASYI